MKDKWLSISKNTTGPRWIADADGNPVHLFGMARCQICAPWDEDPPYGGIHGLCAHFKNLGCNSIRLAFSVFNQEHIGEDFIMQCGGYNEQGIQAYLEKYVDPDLYAIISHGLYVILDWHEYPPNDDHDDPDPDFLIRYAWEHYIPLWREAAKRYRDEPMIAMYELWNEPYAADQGTIRFNEAGIIKEGRYVGYDWNKAVRNFYIDCAAEVRKVDQRHILLLSDWNAGWGCGWHLTWGGKYRHTADPEYKNVIFSVHAGGGQLEAPVLFGQDGKFCFDDYWHDLCVDNNIALQFGEIELEEDINTETSIASFVSMLKKREEECHYPAFLWRPHSDEENYVTTWTEFAKQYTKQTFGGK